MGGKSGGSSAGNIAYIPQFSSQTSSPNPTASAAYNSLLTRAQNVASTPYQAYTGQLVAGLSPQQQQAFGEIGNLQGVAQPYIDQASQMTQGAYNSLAPQNYGQTVSQYYNPYQSSVVDATNAVINQNNAIAQNQLLGSQIASGAGLGDRSGITRATLAGQQALAQNQTIAQLEAQGYSNAQAQAMAGAQLGLGAGAQMAGLGSEALQTGLSGANALVQSGAMQQQQQQNVLNSAYQQWMQQQAFPYQQTGWLGSVEGSVGPLMGGTTSGYSLSGQQQPSQTAQNLGLGIAGIGALGSIPWSSVGSGLSSLGTGLGGLASGLALFSKGGRVARESGGLVPYINGDEPYAGSSGIGYVGQSGMRPNRPDFPALHFSNPQANHQATPQSTLTDALKGGNLGKGLGGIGTGLGDFGKWLQGSSGQPIQLPGANYADGGRVGFDDGGAAGNGLDVESYIRSAAASRGINPDTAVRVAKSEGLGSYVGDAGSSFGPFQLHYGNVAGGGNSVSGLGDEFTRQTGLDARDRATVPQQIDFALDQAKKGGWGPWHGAAKVGIGNWEGLGGDQSGGALAYDGSAPVSHTGLSGVVDAALAGGQPSSLGAAPTATPSAPSPNGGALFSPAFGQALMAAGLGMAASRAPHVGTAIGEGGLAGLGTYNAIVNQERQNALAGAQMQHLGAETQHLSTQDKLSLLQLQYQLEAAKARRAALNGMPAGNGAIVAPKGSFTPTSETTTEAGQPAPEGFMSVAQQHGLPSPADEFWRSVPEQSNPYHLLDLARRYGQAAMFPADPLHPERADQDQKTADQLRGQALSILNSGKVLTNRGMMPIPGYAATEATTAAQKAGAEAQARTSVEEPAKVEANLAQGQLKESREKQTNAANSLMRLDSMEHEFANLPQTGLLSPGAAANARVSLAKNLQQLSTGLGFQGFFDPKQIASAEDLQKETFRLGAELSRQIGGREPGFIVQQAVSANPGIENTPMGFRRIVAGLKASQQYEIDRSTFLDDFYQKNHTLNGALPAFRQAHPESEYVKQAVSSTVPNGALEHLKQHPETAPAFDKHFGKGSAALILGDHQ